MFVRSNIRDAELMTLASPYLLFLGDISEPAFAKTAYGLSDWVPEKCVGEFRIGGTTSIGLPHLVPEEAVRRGAKSLVIGVANVGGVIPESWIDALVQALRAGLDIISGLHVRLSDMPRLVEAARVENKRLIDVRIPPAGLPIGNGRKRSGKRLLTIGTDCAVGKKYTALALTRAFRGKGVDASFCATGQTGIMIAGGGIPIDAVVSDFVAGAAEMLSPDTADDHWHVVEGQGSLLHPAYAAVSLGLLHGSQPDVIVVCHELGREYMLGTAGYIIPSIEDTISLALTLGARTNPAIRCVGVALNTARFSPDEAVRLIEQESGRLQLAVADPLRGGAAFDRLVDACLQ